MTAWTTPPNSMQLATSGEPCKPGLHRQARDNLWQQAQAVFWILLSLFVAFYGNGKHDLITVARQHPDVWRYNVTVLLFASATCSVCMSILKWLQRVGRHTMSELQE